MYNYPGFLYYSYLHSPHPIYIYRRLFLLCSAFIFSIVSNISLVGFILLLGCLFGRKNASAVDLERKLRRRVPKLAARAVTLHLVIVAKRVALSAISC